MRSDLVFSASGRVPNPFLLCHLVRISSRRLHRSGDGMPQTINRILGIVREDDAKSTKPCGLQKAL